MARELPSFVVRNLIEATLKRNDRKPAKKPEKKTLCVAIPTDKRSTEAETLRFKEVKSLLELHKRFEEEAVRKFRKGVVERKSRVQPTSGQNSSNSPPTCNQETTKNEAYFNDICSKLSQVPSPELSTTFPALPGTEGTRRQLQCGPGKRLEPLTFLEKSDLKNCPGTVDSGRPHSCSESWLETDDNLRKENSTNSCRRIVRIPCVETSQNFDDLKRNLTVIQLTSETFPAYDSLARLNDIDHSTGGVVRYDLRNSRNSKSSVLWLVPVENPKSEDALSVNYERYLDDDDVDVHKLDVASNFSENSSGLPLVEYKPIYRKNVHFSQDLHEVHLYSPVQNHRTRRKRGRRRHMEQDY